MMAEFDRDSYRDAKAAVLMPRIVDPRTRTVRSSTLRQLDQALRQTGFRLIDRQTYGPPGGYQLFYANGLIVVRLKTKGDLQGFRANQPHLSAAVTDGRGSKWENDRTAHWVNPLLRRPACSKSAMLPYAADRRSSQRSIGGPVAS